MSLSIKAKIILLQTITAVLLLTVAITANKIISRNSEDSFDRIEKNIKIMNSLSVIKVTFGKEIQEWKNILIRGEDKAALKKHSEGFTHEINAIETESKALRTFLGEEETKYLDSFTKEQDVLKEKYMHAKNEFITDTVFKPHDADKSVKGLDRNVLENLNKLSTFLETRISDNQKISLAKMKKTENVTVITMVVITIGCFIAGFYFSKFLTKELSIVASKVNNGSNHIEEVVLSLSGASTNLSSSIAEQSAAVQETTAAVEETRASVMSNADNAKKSSEQSEESKNLVMKGKGAVENVINSINEMSDANLAMIKQVDENNIKFGEIINVIKEISQKTQVINDIVFQTKLLSFNASVESARAGEHGKGFAVVAEEVGNLAQMSGNSAKEITELLDISVRKVEETINNSKLKMNVVIDLSKEKIQNSSVSAQMCDEVLDEVIKKVSQVDTYIHEISSSSSEQSTSIGEISKAMNELDAASHLNNQASNQVASSADQLKSQVEEFRHLVSILNRVVEGSQA